MPTKEQNIKQAYDNLGGFKSLAAILNKAREKDETVTRKDVKEWKDENVPWTKPLKGYNSYVAPEPKHEFQIDLFNYNFKQKDRQVLNQQVGKKYTAGIEAYGLLAVDAFTKVVHVVPVERKLVSSWKSALDDIFKKMGQPKAIYSDPDSSILATNMRTYLKEKGIELITTRQHASMAERAIRTIKAELDAKIEKEAKVWTVYLPDVLREYNENKVHKTIGMTPKEATEVKNEYEVKTQLEINRVRKRDQPAVEEDDKVRMYKKKSVFDKERVPVWEDGYRRVKKVENVLGQKLYKVDNHDRLVLRSDLLKIGDGDKSRKKAQEKERAAARRALSLTPAGSDPWQDLADKIKQKSSSSSSSSP
jgi:hypothetical protein